MLDVVVATGNNGKLAEIREGLKGFGLNLLSLRDRKIKGSPEEGGESYLQNAVKKALSYAQMLNSVVVADDSGLEVDALGGRPGIFSARYTGGTDSDNIQRLLAEMGDLPWARRTAHFRCAIAFATPRGSLLTAQGECSGFIGYEPKGQSGFGYDPVFYHPSIQQTFGECSLGMKMSLSHRGCTLDSLKAQLPDFLRKNAEET